MAAIHGVPPKPVIVRRPQGGRPKLSRNIVIRVSPLSNIRDVIDISSGSDKLRCLALKTTDGRWVLADTDHVLISAAYDTLRQLLRVARAMFDDPGAYGK